MVPLSLYVTVEVVTFSMLWLVYVDLDMYCDVTNTRAVARSTIITDLVRVQYIFSDKTGTLTQNVMRFKRCSVDGMMFGKPVAKSRPGEENEERLSQFHPLKQLLVGKMTIPKGPELDSESGEYEVKAGKNLTFNAEMFLRVMSLCHTVVVEKDLDQKTKDAAKLAEKQTAQTSKKSWFVWKKSSHSQHPIDPEPTTIPTDAGPEEVDPTAIGPDGAPYGFAYQAESPDEGALVSAASCTFGYQVITRDSNGIRLRSKWPSMLSDPTIVEGLKTGTKTLLTLAAESAANVNYGGENYKDVDETADDSSEETWQILAVNKFDSDRKRMSILLRSPPELGSLPILFCKGADSAMLDPDVCTGLSGDSDPDAMVNRLSRSVATDDENRWELAQTLGLQVHLGDFASEGLRTLVLGMRILSDEECAEWMEEFKAAATALKNRDEKLTALAKKIESQIYIVGATAIEDKLQVGVPETIATLAKAGIKLWVLTYVGIMSIFSFVLGLFICSMLSPHLISQLFS